MGSLCFNRALTVRSYITELPHIPSISATRERLPHEITPERATQSCTVKDGIGWHPAEHAVDLDLKTYSWTCPGSDGTSWFQLKLDQVYCVEQVQVYYKYASARRTWTCSNTDCSHCEGSGCSYFSLTVSTEEAVLSPVLYCKYGDTVKLQCIGRTDKSFPMQEISVTGEKDEI